MILVEERKKEMLRALDEGKRVYFLETRNSGKDEWLIGESEEEVERDVLYYYGMKELPQEWEIQEIKREILEGL